MTKSLLTLLIFRLTVLIFFGQERPTTDSQPKAESEHLGPGDHTRKLTVDGRERPCQILVLRDSDPQKPAPVVPALHGAVIDGAMMICFPPSGRSLMKPGSSWSSRAVVSAPQELIRDPMEHSR